MMNLEGYAYSTNAAFTDYSFESIGPKGTIKKIARFSQIPDWHNVFNFGFGDLNETTGEISDSVISNNNDGDKVLVTAANIIYEFTGMFQNAQVFIQGTTPARTRKYQMGINKHWLEIEPVFEIFGIKEQKWEPFRQGVNYEAFLGRRKTSFVF